MKVGISTGAFFLKVPTEDTFKIINDIGAQTCEVFLATFCEYTPKFAELLAKASDGIDVYSIHTQTMQFEPDLFSAYKRNQEDAEEIFKSVANTANILGAKCYTMHGPARLKRIEYVLNYEQISKRLDELQTILSAKTHGNCQITYENVHYCYYNSPFFFTNLRKNSKILACLDVKQAMQSKISAFDYLDACKDRLANVHLCDYTSEGLPVLPGKGIFNFVDFFVKLMKNNYSGPLIMEPYHNNYNNYSELTAGLNYLKKCLSEAERRFYLNGQ
ncbi:MAG: sugar phosphate isomerase/epimerase [Christensenellaceae bacterium]|jgi:sugar phosphate isomerase/epimerase|nr:sugar phosphate isomerase/epimerase [Christensenellaceae bacterium]